MTKRVRNKKYPTLDLSITLPDETWVKIFINAFPQDMARIFFIGRRISLYFSRMIPRLLVPTITFIKPEMIAKMNNPILIQFINLERMVLLSEKHRWYISENTMKALTRLKRLEINLCGRKLPYTVLGTRIEELSLREGKYKAGQGDDVLKHFTHLKRLEISDCYTIADQSLSRLTTLRSLIISGSYKVTNDSLSTLTNLTSLNIGLNTYRLNSLAFSCLTNLTTLTTNAYTMKLPIHLAPLSSSLKELCIGGVSNEFDQALSYLTALQSLDIRPTTYRDGKISGVGFSTLTNLTSLKMKGGVQILEEKYLSSLSQLQIIELVGDCGLKNETFQRMINLVHISLSSCHELGIEVLLGKPLLEKVFIQNCLNFSEMEEFKRMNPKIDCRYIDLTEYNILFS